MHFKGCQIHMTEILNLASLHFMLFMQFNYLNMKSIFYELFRVRDCQATSTFYLVLKHRNSNSNNYFTHKMLCQQEEFVITKCSSSYRRHCNKTDISLLQTCGSAYYNNTIHVVFAKIFAGILNVWFHGAIITI